MLSSPHNFQIPRGEEGGGDEEEEEEEDGVGLPPGSSKEEMLSALFTMVHRGRVRGVEKAGVESTVVNLRS